MPNSNYAAEVARVREYLATEEGRREMRRLGLCFGYSYPQALAQKVVAVCGIDCYEDIATITDEVLIVELAEKVA